jgi:D-3-phosphoglycerate dehydrogenase
VIGYGNIGSIAADRARGLKMRVIVYDPNVTPEKIEKDGFEYATLEELYQQADYITVHVPKIKQTTGLLNKEAFAKMKDGVMIINCARGGIVDEGDLYDAIKSGKVAGAALDVFATEPPGESPLFELDRVICTPHLGASTKEAQTNVALAVAEQIIEYLKNDTVINAVNMPSVTGELLKQLGPYLSLGDRMGCLQAQLIRGPIKEVAIEYAGNFRDLDMSPVTTAVVKGLLSWLITDDVNSVNAPVIAKNMGIKITETETSESDDYVNLITVKVITTKMTSFVSGLIYGKKDPRVIQINNFRLELIPKGHLALIHNVDRPGAIGSIGTTLGDYDINISRMHVGQSEDGANNVIFLRTDKPLTETIIEKLSSLPVVKEVNCLEL